jgi:F420-dependent methylenetetrahydromethanopterin dehydrogenase
MKSKNLLIVFGLLAMNIVALGQTTISFLYDDSGNRTDRIINMSKSATIGGNTDENDKEELTEAIENLIIKIYPNPTTGKIKVNIAPFQKSSSDCILIYDTNGRSVFRQEHLNPNNMIDIGYLTNGVYLLKLIHGGQTLEWKIIKH